MSTHLPSAPQVLPVPQARQPHCERHKPPSQTCLSKQVTPAHKSTQRPSWHSCPVGQVTPSQTPTHLPARQALPISQVTPLHLGSTQNPLSHSRSVGQRNSPVLQAATQLPWSQTLPTGHRSPSSTMP